VGLAVVTRRQREAATDPASAEANLLAGLTDDLALALDAVRRGASEEAAVLIKRRHEVTFGYADVAARVLAEVTAPIRRVMAAKEEGSKEEE
jgi:hypothetical protein